MPDHVDETIDGAGNDLPTGPDAMRWTPPPPPVPAVPDIPGFVAGRPAWIDVSWPPHLLDDALREVVRLNRSFEHLHFYVTSTTSTSPPEPPPDDPRERALQAARHRGTGPARTPAGKARRPRRHQS